MTLTNELRKMNPAKRTGLWLQSGETVGRAARQRMWACPGQPKPGPKACSIAIRVEERNDEES